MQISSARIGYTYNKIACCLVRRAGVGLRTLFIEYSLNERKAPSTATLSTYIQQTGSKCAQKVRFQSGRNVYLDLFWIAHFESCFRSDLSAFEDGALYTHRRAFLEALRTELAQKDVSIVHVMLLAAGDNSRDSRVIIFSKGWMTVGR